MSNLQRRAFNHLKENLKHPSRYDNFKLHLNTCDIRTVEFKGGIRIGETFQDWSINYNKKSFLFFFWAPWVCTISLGKKIYEESFSDEDVIKDIISYSEEVCRQNKIDRDNDSLNNCKDMIYAIDGGEE